MTRTPEARGPAEAARAWGADLAALLRVRAELIGLELEEEVGRRKRTLLLGTLTAVFSLATLLLAGVLVVMLFWETYRVAAAAGVTLLYGGIAAWAYVRFRDVLDNSPAPFAATLAEFRKDLESLRGTDGPDG